MYIVITIKWHVYIQDMVKIFKFMNLDESV